MTPSARSKFCNFEEMNSALVVPFRDEPHAMRRVKVGRFPAPIQSHGQRSEKLWLRSAVMEFIDSQFGETCPELVDSIRREFMPQTKKTKN